MPLWNKHYVDEAVGYLLDHALTREYYETTAWEMYGMEQNYRRNAGKRPLRSRFWCYVRDVHWTFMYIASGRCAKDNIEALEYQMLCNAY